MSNEKLKDKELEKVNGGVPLNENFSETPPDAKKVNPNDLTDDLNNQKSKCGVWLPYGSLL